MGSLQDSSLNTPQTHFDHWRPIAISLYLAFMSYAVLVGIPVISAAWMTYLHFSEIQVGHLASADLGGMSFGAFLASFVVARYNRRNIILFGIVNIIIFNGLSIFVSEYLWVFLLRLGSGIGCGLCAAIAIATLSATTAPVKAYNKLLIIFTLFQVPEMYFLHKMSLESIYILFIACFLLAIPFVRWIPKYPLKNPFVDLALLLEEQEQTVMQPVSVIPNILPWVCLIAIFFTYINIGAYWTYIEIAGLAYGISQDWISKVLVYGTLFSIISCFVATRLGKKYGLAKPLICSLLCMTVIVGSLSFGLNQWNILFSIFMFNALWIFIDVYQMATISNMDKVGGHASMMPCAQGLGQIVGPSMAAWFLAGGYGYSAVFIASAFAVFISLSVYGLVYSWLQQPIRLIAEAT